MNVEVSEQNYNKNVYYTLKTLVIETPAQMKPKRGFFGKKVNSICIALEKTNIC